MNDDIKKLYALELQMISVATDIEDRGCRIDVPYLEQLKKVLEEKIYEIEEQIRIVDPKLNIGSNSQLLKYFKDSGKEIDNVDEKTLSKIESDSPLAKTVLEYRSFKKLLSTYVNVLLDSHIDGIVHPSFRTIEAETGRLSCTEPALQTIPKEEGEYSIRRSFIPRDGFNLFALDYNQEELRILAHYTQDKTLINLFKKENPDFHSDTATLLNIDRFKAKTLNFSITYGAGKRKVAETLKISQEEAAIIIDNYYKKFPSVKKLMKKAQQTAWSRGYIKTFFGRRRYLNYKHNDQIFDNSHKALNSIIQGTAADIMKIMLIKINGFLKGKNGIEYNYPYGARILLSIHDEIIIEVPIGQEGIISFIKETMEYLPMFQVPMIVDVSLCNSSWANKTKITKEQLDEWKEKPVEILPEDKFYTYTDKPISYPNTPEEWLKAIESVEKKEQVTKVKGTLF